MMADKFGNKMSELAGRRVEPPATSSPSGAGLAASLKSSLARLRTPVAHAAAKPFTATLRRRA